MPLNIRIRQSVKRNLDRTYSARVKWWNGFTGDHSGTVVVPGKTGYIYVRDWNGIVHKVFNNVVRVDVAGLSVKCGYDPYSPGLLRVLGVGNAAFSDLNRPPIVGPHHEQHEWPGYDTVWVQGQQIMPALVGAIGGMNVAVFAHYSRTSSGTFIQVAYTEVDLTSYVPASGAAWGVISVKDDGTIDVDATTTAAGLYALVNTPINAPSDPSYRPLAAAMLVAGMTSIEQTASKNRIVDLRWALGSRGVVLTDDYDLNDNGIVDESESTWALRGKSVDPTIAPVNGSLLMWNDANQQYESVVDAEPNLRDYLEWDGTEWTTAAPNTYYLAMQDGVTSPPVPVENEDGTDWLYIDS